MKNRFPAWVACVAVVAGCASYPPPRVVNGYYVDYGNSFTFAAPEKWKLVDEIPDRFLPPSQFVDRDTMPSRYESNIGVFSDSAFVNESNTGVIAVDTSQSGINYGTSSREDIRRSLESTYADSLRKMNQISGFSGYNYTVSADVITERPTLLARVGFNMKLKSGTFRCEEKLYAFTARGGTNLLKLTLISEEQAFKENLAIFEAQMKSVKRSAQTPDAKH